MKATKSTRKASGMKLDRGYLPVAEKVLKAVERKLSPDMFKDGYEPYVDLYVNGRERGYSLAVYAGPALGRVNIMFSENRNSDDIVIYVGSDLEDGKPTEESYANRKLIDAGKYNDAADYIISRIKKISRRRVA